MTFEDATQIAYPTRFVERWINVYMADGTKAKKLAYVRHNFGILDYAGAWHVIHVPSENGIYETKSYDDAVQLVDLIIERRIDTNWGYRDLHVFKSILQLIGARKEHKLRNGHLSQRQKECGGDTSVQQGSSHSAQTAQPIAAALMNDR
jgi:hypothetical protein